jgi:hypothetical protein
MEAGMENGFDFDVWMALARQDPEEFERRRNLANDEIFARQAATGANVRRLVGLRWRIDMEHARAKTPLQCCVRLSSLMWDSFYDMSHALSKSGFHGTREG